MNIVIQGINYYCVRCGYGARLKSIFKRNHSSEHRRWLTQNKKKKED